MAEFSITSGVLMIGSEELCATDISLSYTAEELSVQCMNENTPTVFPGQESWNGTANVAYPADGLAWAFGGAALFEFTITKSTGGTIVLFGEVVISDVSSAWNKSEIPQATLTFEGNGDLTESA
jgi:hypothetical protein